MIGVITPTAHWGEALAAASGTRKGGEKCLLMVGHRDSGLLRDHRLLVLALWTGGQPTLRTHEMVCLYLQGWADKDELLAHLQKLKPYVG